jgi:acyl-CoA oxidase
VGAEVRSAVRDRNFVAARRSDSEAVRDADFHLHALEFRERSLLHSLARRIKRRVAEGTPSQEAFEACQDHALSLARAYVERFALQSFQKAAAEHEGLRPLCALYGLDCLAADLSWFLENDYVAPSKSRAIRKETNALLAELAPRAIAYTEAFAIPETCLGPLADAEYLVVSGLAGVS